MAKLTDKQSRFISEYLIDLNATQAAIRAGYSEKTSKQTGCENLAKPDIQEAIQAAQQEIAEANNITVIDIADMHKEAFEMARDKEQSSAMTSSARNLSELLGFLVHKTQEISDRVINVNYNVPDGTKPDSSAT